MSKSGGRHFDILFMRPKSENSNLLDLVKVLHSKTVEVNYIEQKECILIIHLHLFASEWLFFLCNSEVMTSFPHNLLLVSQTCFKFAPSKVLDLYNFLIN